MRIFGKWLLTAILIAAAACGERGPRYTVGDSPDASAVTARILEIWVDTLSLEANRLRVDVLLDGDVTAERATAVMSSVLDSLQRARPQVTIVRGIGFILDFAAATERHVPVKPVLEAVHLPINGDTLHLGVGVRFRTHVNHSGDLPSEAQ